MLLLALPVLAASFPIGGEHPIQVYDTAPDGTWVLYRQLREPPDDTPGPRAFPMWTSPEWAGPGDLHLHLPSGEDRVLHGQERVAADPDGGWVLLAGGGLLTLLDAHTGETLVLGSGDQGSFRDGRLLYLVGRPNPMVLVRELATGATRRITRAGAAWFSDGGQWIETCPEPAPPVTGDVVEGPCARTVLAIRAFPADGTPGPDFVSVAWLLGAGAVEPDPAGGLRLWRADGARALDLPEGCTRRVWRADDQSLIVVGCGEGDEAPLYRIDPEGGVMPVPATVAQTRWHRFDGELVQVGTRVLDVGTMRWQEMPGEGLLSRHGGGVFEWDGEGGRFALGAGSPERVPWPAEPPLRGSWVWGGAWVAGERPSGGWARCGRVDLSCVELSAEPLAIADDGRVLVAQRRDSWRRVIGPLRWEEPGA